MSGADANAQDVTGRTALHAAIAADAQGVFQILLASRSTQRNARTFDGTTPLILAARLNIEGMVEELLQRDVDINAADDSGEHAHTNAVHAILLLYGVDCRVYGMCAAFAVRRWVNILVALIST